LYVYNPDKGVTLGANGEYIGAPRLDNLQCTYAAFTGLLEAVPCESAAVFCAFDNEEVGSSSRHGADSDFLEATLTRVCESMGMSKSEYYAALSHSFMMSADNAHALHPNHPELSDGSNAPKLNGGIVVKYNANQKYTTDSVSSAVTVSICEKAEIPHQVYANRSDKPGGSTLGNIASTHVSVMSADVGLAQLSMHSAFETAGALDTEYFCRFAKEFYNTSIKINEGSVILK
ncbi:MAG: M18 family aminopeptidase, partial [Clostridia bacterium]|nr:M18 family aminopeptidase [Clostridia bacterium]